MKDSAPTPLTEPLTIVLEGTYLEDLNAYRQAIYDAANPPVEAKKGDNYTRYIDFCKQGRDEAARQLLMTLVEHAERVQKHPQKCRSSTDE